MAALTKVGKFNLIKLCIMGFVCLQIPQQKSFKRLFYWIISIHKHPTDGFCHTPNWLISQVESLKIITGTLVVFFSVGASSSEYAIADTVYINNTIKTVLYTISYTLS